MGNSLYRLLTGSMHSTMSKFMLETGFKCGLIIGYSLQLLVFLFCIPARVHFFTDMNKLCASILFWSYRATEPLCEVT